MHSIMDFIFHLFIRLLNKAYNELNIKTIEYMNFFFDRPVDNVHYKHISVDFSVIHLLTIDLSTIEWTFNH